MKKLSLFILSLFVFAACSTGGGGTDDGGNGSDDGDGGVQENPAITVEDCFNETVLYESADTPLKFCYQPSWGEPSSEVMQGASGSKTVLSFPNAEGEAPTLTYYSEDFEPAEGEEPLFYQYDELYVTFSEDQLSEDFAELTGLAADSFTLRKVQIDDSRAVRVRHDGQLSYYIPDAFDDNDLEISGSESLATELDDMAQLMISF